MKKRKYVAIRVTKELRDKLKTLAAKKGWSMIKLLKEYLNE